MTSKRVARVCQHQLSFLLSLYGDQNNMYVMSYSSTSKTMLYSAIHSQKKMVRQYYVTLLTFLSASRYFLSIYLPDFITLRFDCDVPDTEI